MTRRQSRTTVRQSRHAERQRFERAIEMYLTDCYEKRTVARISELADFLKANRFYLSRIIPQLFGGKNLHTVLRERQLTHAARLLTLTPLRIEEVAAASGFGHRSTFFRVFLKAFGSTPAEYRDKVTKRD